MQFFIRSAGRPAISELFSKPFKSFQNHWNNLCIVIDIGQELQKNTRFSPMVWKAFLLNSNQVFCKTKLHKQKNVCQDRTRSASWSLGTISDLWSSLLRLGLFHFFVYTPGLGRYYGYCIFQTISIYHGYKWIYFCYWCFCTSSFSGPFSVSSFPKYYWKQLQDVPFSWGPAALDPQQHHLLSSEQSTLEVLRSSEASCVDWSSWWWRNDVLNFLQDSNLLSTFGFLIGFNMILIWF